MTLIQSTSRPHHPVFDKIGDAMFFTAAPDDRLMGWGGGQVNQLPPVNEEYFEWIDLLEALLAAGDRFVMVELGAGYGRWGLRGAHIAKRLDKQDIQIRFIEAEPQHAQWARDAIQANGFDAEKLKVIEAAIAYDRKPLRFAISGKDLDAATWYGQALFPDTASPETVERYFDKPVYRHPGGWGLIEVETRTLEEVVADLDMIDFIDMDLQGAERQLVENSIETLNEKVRRVHIGTHSIEIENAIRRTFDAAGWTIVWDFGIGSEVQTPYGRVAFGDGVQSWINPRHSPPSE